MPNKQPTDARLTHRIITDAGQWVRAATEAEARAEFKKQHSGRNLRTHQVWAVTPNMVINEDGRFSAPRAEYCPPERLSP